MDTSRWNDYEAPFRMAGPIYFVGTTNLAVFLVHTPQGHILIDGGMPSTAPVIEKSIRELGFKPEDIRILLTTQAHFDHVGSHAHFKKLSGARVEAMKGDETLLRDGGASDYLFGARADFHFPRVAVDRVLSDGDIVTIGGARLTARHTPGHTPGSATYLMDVQEAGRDYRVVFAASTSVNPGTGLAKNPSVPWDPRRLPQDLLGARVAEARYLRLRPQRLLRPAEEAHPDDQGEPRRGFRGS